MKLNLKFALAFCIFGVLSLGNRQAVSAAPPTDACSLLTPAQVSAVLGFSAKPGHPGIHDTTTCVWPLENFSKMGSKDTKLVQVHILSSQDWAKIAPLVRAFGTVKGVGDAAVYSPGNSLPIPLYVKKGNSEFTVFMLGFPPEQVKAKEKTLALDVLKSL